MTDNTLENEDRGARRPALAGDDKVVPFHVAPLEVRGRAVQLGPVLDAMLSRHDYPAPIAKLLGEVIVLTVLLGTSLKFEGKFTVQTKTDGPVSMLVTDFTTPDSVRAYASFDAGMLDEYLAAGKSSPQDLLGNGFMAMTIDQGNFMQRYQGIVALEGNSLEEVAQAYFRQSEQIPTHLRMAVAEAVEPDAGGQGSTHSWRAGGVLIQFLPENMGRLTVRDIPGGDAPEGASETVIEERDDLWVEARSLVETVSDDELTDPQIGTETLLYRLFHERGVHVFDGPQVADKCSCSREKIVGALSAMDRDELADSWIDGRIESTCQFCSTVYSITAEEIGH